MNGTPEDPVEAMREELSTYEDAGIVALGNRLGIPTGPGVTRDGIVNTILDNPDTCTAVLKSIRDLLSSPIPPEAMRHLIRPVEDDD